MSKFNKESIFGFSTIELPAMSEQTPELNINEIICGAGAKETGAFEMSGAMSTFVKVLLGIGALFFILAFVLLHKYGCVRAQHQDPNSQIPASQLNSHHDEILNHKRETLPELTNDNSHDFSYSDCYSK